MPTRRIDDPDETKEKAPPPCFSADHEVPSLMVFAPGTYQHTCSGCGRTIVFTVRKTWGL